MRHNLLGGVVDRDQPVELARPAQGCVGFVKVICRSDNDHAFQPVEPIQAIEKAADDKVGPTAVR